MNTKTAYYFMYYDYEDYSTHCFFTIMNTLKRAPSNFAFQGSPNPGFMSVKVQTETFLKKDSQDFKNYFYLEFL